MVADRTSYARALLTRWSRRDRLTVLVVGVTTAFLVGSVLLLAAAGAQTATIAGDLNTTTTVTHEDSYADARASATDGELVFPTTVLTDADGDSHRFVGIPASTRPEIADAAVEWRRASLPSPNQSVQGPVDAPTTRRFRTGDGTVTYEVQPHASANSLFPAEWYVANASLVRTLGTEQVGAFVIHPGEGASGLLSVPQTGTPLLAALIFLFAGMRELLAVLLAATLGSALLVLVVVYNVLRMTVRDRTEAIRVIRSTGGTSRRVLALFGIRAGLIVAVGVALGYAIGVILTNAVVNVAVYAGLPISLSPTLTPLAVSVLAVVLVTLVLAGVLAGVLAARSAANRPPARLATTGSRTPSHSTRSRLGRVRSVLTPTLLDGRAIVPTALTLAVFVVVVILVVAFAGAIGPLSSPGEATVAEADAPHVLNSRIDTSYASVLRSEGYNASPEILLAEAVNGEPFLGLGANYTAFAAVTNATLQAGRAPNRSTEAVIGTDLAKTLGVEVGESMTLGGSFSPALTRVTVVGRFDATGITDDQLVVPLSTAHHLSIREGYVQYIRTARTSALDTLGRSATNASAESSISITGVSAPDVVEANRSFTVDLQLRNLETTNATRQVTMTAGDVTRTISVSLGPEQRTQRSVSLRIPTAGNRTLRVGSTARPLRVLPRNALVLPSELPNRAPPNATLYVPVVTADERPIANATVIVGNTTQSTGSDGVARLTLPTNPGAYTITASKGDRPTASHNLSITSTARRHLSARLRVTPQTASVLERPVANVTVANPWDTTISRELVLTSPATSRTRNVTLDPGETAAIETTITGGSADQRAAPGTYTVRLLANGSTLARTEYTITGDDRLFSALASNGQYSQGAGLGQAVRSVFGNIQLLFVTMVFLAGLTTVGTTTATFAQVIHARRRAIGIHRATGATPRGVLRTVLVDVCLISLPATVIALGLAVGTTRLLQQLGTLTAFGIRLSTTTPTTVLLGAAAGAFLLAVIGAVVAVLPFLSQAPTRLLSGSSARNTPEQAET